MKRITSAHWLCALFAAASMQAGAQTIPAMDFARANEVNEVSLSPDGRYVALTAPTANDMETRLQIGPLEGGKTQTLRFGPAQHVADVLWTSDSQLVVSRARTMPMRARPVSFGELMSTDIAGKNQSLLFGYVKDELTRTGRRKDQGFARVIGSLEAEPGVVLVAFDCWQWVCGEEPPSAVYRVDSRTGERREVERYPKPADFAFDRTGRARVRTTLDGQDEPVLAYRPDAAGAWQPVPRSLAGRTMQVLSFAPDNATAFAAISDRGEPAALYRVDLAHATRTRLAGRDDVAIASTMSAGRGGEPFAVWYDAAKPSLEYLDPTSDWARLHAGLMKSFPGEMVSFLDTSRDGRKVLFNVWSDRHVGAYYVFDRDAGRAQLIAESAPWLDPAKLAPVRPIAFQARDGQTLYGLYTAQGGGPRPLVVMPHGGPHGPYDRWGFDADAQFLASRGYAVLQVNYRGSGGRGETFEKSGYREWGGKVMDDIADGVRWTIGQQLADPARICTYGASFGGYAAMMNPIRYPGMYRCAVGHVGVYDLALMRTAGDIPDMKSGVRYLDRAIGADATTLAAASPARQAAQLTIPVLLVQGKRDNRVPMDQFNALDKALRAEGRPPETLVVAGEGHGFYKPENQAELYRRLEDFLGRNLPPAQH